MAVRSRGARQPQHRPPQHHDRADGVPGAQPAADRVANLQGELRTPGGDRKRRHSSGPGSAMQTQTRESGHKENKLREMPNQHG